MVNDDAAPPADPMPRNEPGEPPEPPGPEGVPMLDIWGRPRPLASARAAPG
jgi:hypothetical protein